jgi:hypothetical protein
MYCIFTGFFLFLFALVDVYLDLVVALAKVEESDEAAALRLLGSAEAPPLEAAPAPLLLPNLGLPKLKGM